jgi:hypothetical protein
MRAVLGAALVAMLACGGALAQPARGLTGVWSNATFTPLERPGSQTRLILTDAEAKAARDANFWTVASKADARPTDPNAGAPTDGNVGGYNMFWMDAGADLARVNGQYRTSWIVKPANGKLPLTEAGRLRSREAALTRNREDPIGPEHLSPNDRCIIGSRGSGGPGMLANIYNSNYQIVETPASLVIVVETGGNARTIPIFKDKQTAQAAHGPAALAQWLGDSVAWRDGADVVVETINVKPQQGEFGPIFLSPKGRVTEWFRRVSEKEMFYAFEVEDPVYYTEPWRAETTFYAIPGLVYEFACHEGNYAIQGILGGARAVEKRQASGGQP